jgi:hypothetical protein
MRAWLGRESDVKVARRLGVTPKAARRERLRLGIPSARPAPRKVIPSPALRPLLAGSGATAMKALGVGHDTLILLRRQLGVEVRHRAEWTRRVLAKLGRVPDDQVAAELGIASSAVARKRSGMGIRKLREGGWTPREDALVRKLPRAEAAARTGKSLSAVGKRRRLLGVTRAWRYAWSKSALARLGHEPDAAIAADLGIPRVRVTRKRRDLGLLFMPASRPWKPAEDEILRRLPPGQAAEQLGRTRAAIRDRRHKLGLGRRGRPGRRSRQAPALKKRPTRLSRSVLIGKSAHEGG